MGLRSDLSDSNGDIFSEDVLTVEIYGPKEEHLTIIDVPGIFRTTGEGTTKGDMDIVRSLVRNYIKDDRTIILAVLPSNVDIATQEILQLAEDYDKNGERTIGVLTKPDLVSEPSAQAAVCDLVMGKRRPLRLGYYLIRNHGAENVLPGQANPEQFYQTSPWDKLPRDRVGIPALKEQLQTLLDEISRREFPRLVIDLKCKVKECHGELDKLGPSRQNQREQRNFLSQIAGKFQDVVRAGLTADYNVHSMFDQEQSRLVTQVVNIMDAFAEDFRLRAHLLKFDHLTTSDECSPSYDGFDHDDIIPQKIQKKPADFVKLEAITKEEFEELGDLVHLEENVPDPCDNMSDWIRNMYQRSRGMDLGTFNPHLVSTAFAQQSSKWESMTRSCLSRVIVSIHRFIRTALERVCSDVATCRNIWLQILDELLNGYSKALEQMELLIHVNQRKQPWTLNGRFNEMLAKARAERVASLLRPQARLEAKQFGEPQQMVNLAAIPQAIKAQSNAEYLQEEIHDILHAYYNLALDRYIDNIFQLSVDYHLLTGPDSPFKVFTHDWVLELDPGKLEQIAGESKSIKKSRDRVKGKLSNLEEALRVLKQD